MTVPGDIKTTPFDQLWYNAPFDEFLKVRIRLTNGGVRRIGFHLKSTVGPDRIKIDHATGCLDSNETVSDDEDETFKHIDTPSLFRWRHQSRLEKMAAAKKERDDLNRKKEGLQKKNSGSRESDDRRSRFGPGRDERQKWVTQLKELKKLEQEYEEKEKEKEVAKKERFQPWNVDTIGRLGFSKSRINVSPNRAQPAAAKTRPAEKDAKLMQFQQTNRALIRKFCSLTTFDETEQFLLDYPKLCCDEMASLLAAECCKLEYEDERERMEKVAHQATILNYLLEMAARLKWPAGNRKLISAAMAKFKKAQESQGIDAFQADVRGYADLVIEQEEKRKKRLGPGGLDPLEVIKELPEEMRRCFERKDAAGLQRLAMEMPTDEFAKHLQRCIDSGLWVVNAGQADQQKDKAAATDEPMDDEQGDGLDTCTDVSDDENEKPKKDSDAGREP